MVKNLVYALLLGAGMAACLAEGDKTEAGAEAPGELETEAAGIAETLPDPAHFTIGKRRIGSIEVGMPVEQLRTQVPAHFILIDTLLHQEGQAYTAYRLRQEASSNTLLIEQQCEPSCSVWRISTSSPGFKTAAGIGVGSDFADVQRRYQISNLSTSEAGLVAVAEKENISFVLDQSALPPERLSSPTPADIPASTPVKRIFVY